MYAAIFTFIRTFYGRAHQGKHGRKVGTPSAEIECGFYNDAKKAVVEFLIYQNHHSYEKVNETFYGSGFRDIYKDYVTDRMLLLEAISQREIASRTAYLSKDTVNRQFDWDLEQKIRELEASASSNLMRLVGAILQKFEFLPKEEVANLARFLEFIAEKYNDQIRSLSMFGTAIYSRLQQFRYISNEIRKEYRCFMVSEDVLCSNVIYYAQLKSDEFEKLIASEMEKEKQVRMKHINK